jgi:LysM repeat protein
MDVIEINRKKLKKQKETQIIEDVIVPDIKEDIVSIIDVNGITYAYKIEKSDGKIKMDGNLECHIVYVSNSGDTRGIVTTFKFSDILEANDIKAEMTLKYKIDLTKIETKILNERKVNITANLLLTYDLYERQKIEIYNDFENIENLQIQSKFQTLNSIVGINTGKAQVKEEIKCNDVDNLAEILRYDINVKNKETKVSYNKILAKAEVEVTIMYLTEDNRISILQSEFPIMSFIDLENVKEDNFCNIDYQMRNVLFKIKSDDTHIIECQLDFELICEAYEVKEIQVVSDLYSLKKDVEFDIKELETDVASTKSENTVDMHEKIEIDDVKKVLYIDANGRIINNTISGDTSNIEGEVELKVYYELASQMGLNVKIVTVPFITKVQNIEKNLEVNILQKEFDLDGNEVIVNLKTSVTSGETRTQKVKIVSNVEIKELTKKDDYSVVVYFVKPSDTLWKIGKDFKVTVDSLIKVNDLENPDIIYPGDKLYIVK